MKIRFSYIMLLVALSVASCAGYYSIFGLSQLFAGASTAIILMASILEVAKVVTTSALHKYWNKIAKSLRIYLTVSVIVLMVITSAGIYGFLSNAYQRTANKLELQDGQVSVLIGKKSLFEKTITENEKIISNKNKRSDQLSRLRDNQETRIDSAKSTRAKDKARLDIEKATFEIQKLSADIDELNSKNSILSDSISKYNMKALEIRANSTVTAEVGPLKYIATLTSLPMDRVVNYLILLLIFVFDPLAIALILMTNKVFELQDDDNTPQTKKESPKEELPAPKEVFEEINLDDDADGVSEGAIEGAIEGVTEGVTEGAIDEPWNIKTEESIQKKEPVITTGKIELKDIDKSQRIGSNKIIKNGDNNKVYFKRNK